MKHTLNAYKITWFNKYGEHSFYEYTKRTAENSMKRFANFNPTMEETVVEVCLTPAIKREFQKVIKNIRESDFNPESGMEYPKAIMTDAMTERGEATIIFSWQGSYASEEKKEYTRRKAEKMLKVESFLNFLDKEQATAQIELKENNNYQIRIKF